MSQSNSCDSVVLHHDEYELLAREGLQSENKGDGEDRHGLTPVRHLCEIQMSNMQCRTVTV